MNSGTSRAWGVFSPVLSTCLVLLATGALAQEARVPGANANELVRRVVKQELEAEPLPYMFKLRREKPGGSQTREMIETKEGLVARLLAINDRPLTPQEREEDERRLQYLLSHPEEQRRKQREQQQDNERVNRMFKSLPDAFLYEYDGTEPSKNGQLIRLKFRPNPQFSPPSREMSVFRGMEGVMWVDASSERLVRIEGKLFRDVNFGWGILGHLDRGGHFMVEQSDVGGGQWKTTSLNIRFTGKALFFKTINLQQNDTTSDFRRVPPDLSMTEGIELLKKVQPVVAENQPSQAAE